MSYVRRTELTCSQDELAQYADKVLLKNEMLCVVRSSGRRDIYYGDGKTPISGLEASISFDELVSMRDEVEQNKEAAAQAAMDAVLAETAAEAADNAKADAEQAKTDAQTAQERAETAQTAAETAKTDAVTAQQSAETAQSGAEQAKTDAETAQQSAEQAKVDALAAQAGAESARDQVQASADQIATNTISITNLTATAANAFRGTMAGATVSASDVSPYPHNLSWAQYGECTQNGTPTPDAPVAVVCPVAGLSVGGKNLYPYDTQFDDNKYVHSCPEMLAFVKTMIVGQTYAHSAEITGERLESAAPIGQIRLYDNDSNSCGMMTLGKPYAATESLLDAVACYIYGSTTGATLKNIQFEIGSTATDYEPYKAPATVTVTDSAGEPVILRGVGNYKDTLVDNGDGTGTVTRYVGVTDLGIFGWQPYPSQFGYSAALPGMKSGSFMPGFCSTLQALKSHSGMGLRLGAVNSAIYAERVSDAYPTASDFKSAMSGSLLYFILATPTTETVTISPATVQAVAPTTTIVADAYTEAGYNRDSNAVISDLQSQIAQLTTAMVALGTV